MTNPSLAPDAAFSHGTATPPAVARLRRTVVIGLALFFVAAVPGLNLLGAVADDKVQTLGRYLTFALVAIGLDLVWGYTGMLSLCQALFFCIGGYAMAMHLALPEGGGDVRPEYDYIPQLFSTISVKELPGFWKPFASLPFAVLAGPLLAGTLATVFGFFIFRSRVRGVYFSILTQAVAWGALLVLNQSAVMLGGETGITNFNKALSERKSYILLLYLLTCVVVVGGYLVALWVTRSRLGRIMVAIRDKEMRLYFAGYKPYAFKVFVFALAAVLGAVGGMLYPLQFTSITPQDMNVSASILVAIMVTIGGRGTLWGSAFGALLIMVARGSLSSSMPTLWPYVYGGLFVATVLFFPDGFAGLWAKVEQRLEEGAGRRAVIAAAAPIAVVAFFLGGEALGLTPRFLHSVRPLSVPLFYLLLVAALVGAFLFERQVVADLKVRATEATGFPIAPAQAA